MLNIRQISIGLIATLLACCPAMLAQQAVVGQSLTQLPDGSTLLLGGMNPKSVPTSDAFLLASGSAQPQPIAGGMNFTRSGHTATVLPDGTVFIFGGMGTDGKIVATAELFDPASRRFSVLPDVIAVPRAFHTATVLTNGTLLLAGGIANGGQFSDDVQVWDFRTRKAISQHALLMMPRQGHAAFLLADGSVRLAGGTDHFGRPVLINEIYDSIAKRFRFIGKGEDDQVGSGEEPQIAASLPEDGATGVSVNTLVAVRFSSLMDVKTIHGSSFVLSGSDEHQVGAKVTAAENGRLAFVLPEKPLLSGRQYVLRIANAIDAHGKQMPETSISFQTAGMPPEPPEPEVSAVVSGDLGPAASQWQQMPPLQAPMGTTAVAGQVLKLNGWPLEHVQLEMDGKKTFTDLTGRFLLAGLTPGHHVLWIDGGPASRGNAAYGIYEVGVTVLAGKTNVLNYTIWMTRLDMAHAVRITSPIKAETVITTPLLPVLELHLPPNTVIRDRHGAIVRQVSITPVPIAKPPFPLPAGVEVPLYFTIQPGGAYISIGNKKGAGARLIYPNAGNAPPHALFDFWNYDADGRNWFIYGQGRVSSDARSVMPEPGIEIYEFTGAMVQNGSNAPGTGPYAGFSKERGDPVDLATGQFIYNKTDLTLPDILPISLTRTYITNDARSRSFGVGATLSYDMFMVGDRFPYTYQELVMPDGGRIRFDRISAGTSFGDAVYVHTSTRTAFYGAVLKWNPDSTLLGVWQLKLKDGTVYRFLDNGPDYPANCGAMAQIIDRYGNKITLQRTPIDQTKNSYTWCQLTKIISASGRSITLTRDNQPSQQRITQAQDSTGRTVTYTYDAAGRLSTMTDAAGGVTTYTYDDQGRMLTIKDARQIVYLTNQFDSAGRVIQQTDANNNTHLFSWTAAASTAQTRFYSFDPNPGAGSGSAIIRNGCWNGLSLNRYSSNCVQGYMPLVAQVDVTDPRGYVERVVFNGAGYPTSDTHALNQPEQQTVTYAYYADNLPQSVTDALGRTTSYDYDGNGNMTRITRLDGTANAVTTTFSYEPFFDHLASITDPLGHSSTFKYDGMGNLVSATDPLNHQTTFGHNGYGQLTSVTDPLNHTVSLGYFGGDLVSVADLLGNVSTQNFDTAGRVIATVDPQGNTTQFQYNSLNLLTQATDSQGNVTAFAYDANGNLFSLTDALNHITSYTYDNMDRPATRTDPLLRQESHSYDQNGNLVSSTDRKGQVTTLTYDPLNRLKLVGYNTIMSGGNTTYESTISYTYDPGNRMTQAVDSAGSTITESYDNLDRLASETTCNTGASACGQINYGYDLAGRRTSMTVAGQPQVTYSYDNADRLTQIAQGTSTVGFSYDNANRRSTLTLSNGVNIAYTYDNDSRVTGITYKYNVNTLGDLAYTYDSLGRRTLVNGSFARTSLPGAVTSATYDAANELSNWNGTSISYDLNGNMLSDGTNTFSWNARNQVAALNGVSLQYDAFGRRTQNAAGRSFLYDGANAAQELSGSTVLANLLSGGIDEAFTRADSGGTFTQLKDALGSTIALVDSSDNIQTSYSYDPFGNTVFSGTLNANSFQYTGRENEGNGLYFYRARFYNPLLSRFISQDPLGFAGSGPNLYTYVGNDPINFRDPSGLIGPGAATTAAAGTTATTAEVNAVAGPLVEGVATDMGLGAGFGTAVETGSAGGPVGVAYAAVAATGYSSWLASSAEINANEAYAQELQAIAKLNTALLAHPKPFPLAGRYNGAKGPNGGNGGGDDGCDEERRNARDFCSNLAAMPRSSPEWRNYINIWGGNLERCIRGQVSERCGGNRVN